MCSVMPPGPLALKPSISTCMKTSRARCVSARARTAKTAPSKLWWICPPRQPLLALSQSARTHLELHVDVREPARVHAEHARGTSVGPALPDEDDRARLESRAGRVRRERDLDAKRTIRGTRDLHGRVSERAREGGRSVRTVAVTE
jgi:hypothetical protein